MNGNATPLVSLAIICYRQEKFVADALKSALAQTYSPLEIIVSDDCSPDGTYEVVKAVAENYSGPHKLIINRNPGNLGLAGNVNKVWELAHGELVIFQGGDDISLPHRAISLVTAWQSRVPRPDLVYSAVKLIDEDGKEIGERLEVVKETPAPIGTITGKNVFIAGGCAAAYSRGLHDKVGPLDRAVVSEDFVYSFRALLGNGVVGVSDPLVLYRQHGESIIGSFRTRKTSSKRKRDMPMMKAGLANFREHRKALNVYGSKSFMLRLILSRRITSLEVEISAENASRWQIVGIATWAMATIRLRLALALLTRLIN